MSCLQIDLMGKAQSCTLQERTLTHQHAHKHSVAQINAYKCTSHTQTYFHTQTKARGHALGWILMGAIQTFVQMYNIWIFMRYKQDVARYSSIVVFSLATHFLYKIQIVECFFLSSGNWVGCNQNCSFWMVQNITQLSSLFSFK